MISERMVSERVRAIPAVLRYLINRRDDWANFEFDLQKAYCMGMFSELVYFVITGEEYKNADRSEIVPCEYHAAAVQNGYRIEFAAALSETFDFSVIETKYFVALIIFDTKLITCLSQRNAVFVRLDVEYQYLQAKPDRD
jgi:hypothetical protein